MVILGTATTKSGKKVHRCLKRGAFGRAGVSEPLWRDVMETRWKAGLAAGHAGNLTMGWQMPTPDTDGRPYRSDALRDKRRRRQKLQFDTYGKLKGNG